MTQHLRKCVIFTGLVKRITVCLYLCLHLSRHFAETLISDSKIIYVSQTSLQNNWLYNKARQKRHPESLCPEFNLRFSNVITVLVKHVFESYIGDIMKFLQKDATSMYKICSGSFTYQWMCGWERIFMSRYTPLI